MSKTRIIMHGCNGAMGQVISRLAAEDENVEIVAGLDIADKGLYDYPVYVNPVDCQSPADVIVDFSVAPAVDGFCFREKAASGALHYRTDSGAACPGR